MLRDNNSPTNRYHSTVTGGCHTGMATFGDVHLFSHPEGSFVAMAGDASSHLSYQGGR